MITLEEIRQAAGIIKDQVLRTPLIHSPALTGMFGAEIFLKLENLQKTGSFKIRGATHRIMKGIETIGPRGVVAASAGNHAQGVALAARQMDLPATIVMPEWASITKQEATRAYGGKVVIAGATLGESLETARRLAAEGRTFIHPFDDPDVISGQGTIALEVLADLPDADTLVVPVGGGGLISGIATAAKSIRPGIEVIGVESAACPSAFESRRSGKITRVASSASIADGISVKQPGDLTFEILRDRVDDLVLVEEEQIASAMLLLLERKKILSEGSGAVPLAALMSGAIQAPRGSKVVLVISGGNVDSPLLGRILRQGLLKNGRVMRVRIRLEDIPGALACLLTAIARLKANVLTIYHDRGVPGMPIYITHVELELETRGPDHVEEIAQTLQGQGYEMRVKS